MLLILYLYLYIYPFVSTPLNIKKLMHKVYIHQSF
nr:MAG TPA: hypothetical protein [Caudoviricetes sp.]